MKRCPTCYLTYRDESLNFCRRDGTPLVGDSSALADAQATLIKLPPRTSDDMPTEVFRSGPVSGSVSTSSSLTAPLQRRRRAAKSKVIDSLAVLPLVNESADPHSEYLSDGITESIINSLSQLPKLRVVPRTTVFRYKGKEVDPQVVGQELDVRAVLTGRMLQMKDLLIVKTELVDVASESQVWGEQYRHEMKDIFVLQEEISREISAQLRLKLSGDEKKRLVKRYTENTEAYHLYLKGRYYTNKRTEEWIKKGVEHFQQATDLDPNYALAYAGLADAYAFLASSTGGLPPREAYPQAKAAAMRALEIDERLAEAHTSLGFCHLMYDWDFEKAEREFKRAIKLNPAYANAHDGYGFYLKATGQHEEAILESKRAQRLDPLSLFANVSLAWAYYFARRYDGAVEQARKALEMDPRFDFAHWIIGVAYVQQKRLEEAISVLNHAVILTGGSLTHLAHLGCAYALAGRAEEARQVLEDLEEMAQHKYVSAYYFALIQMGLGDDERMFEWLARAVEERAGFMAFINTEPLFDHLRAEPRFVNLVRQIKAA
jgi:TolB-like protein/Flp pilus assembly protein TadD